MNLLGVCRNEKNGHIENQQITQPSSADLMSHAPILKVQRSEFSQVENYSFLYTLRIHCLNSGSWISTW